MPKGVAIKVAEQATFRESPTAEISWGESVNIVISFIMTHIRAV
jgi:hypothetical protein